MKTALFWIVLLIAAVTGWGMNLYKLTQCDFESPYKCEVLRTVGLVPPIGAIMGYIDLDK